jgi:sec-independent protein translocase protein TatA
MSTLNFLFISGAEIFFIMFIVVMVFGADKIPGIAKGLGKGMRQLKDATEDIKQEIQKSAEKQGLDTDFAKDIKKELDEVKSSLTDVSNTVKRK